MRRPEAPIALRRRFLALQALLQHHAPFWQTSPFHIPRPAWCADRPGLAAAALSLTEPELTALSRDTATLLRWLSRWLPEVAALESLTTVPIPDTGPGPPGDPATAPRSAAPAARFFAGVPGRKRTQIEAFAAAVKVGGQPLLEWCAGKGHLGRLLSRRHGLPVTSLEIDGALCGAGRALARRVGVAQTFSAMDVLAADARRDLEGRHAVALHACGDLHRALVTALVETGAPALDLAPCCYDRTAAPVHRPLSDAADLPLDRLALRLAVTDMATGGARDRRRWRTEQTWKLAYKQLRRTLGGPAFSAGIAPVPRHWLERGFEGWCRALLQREGLEVPASVPWETLLREGDRLRGEFDRLNLVRLGFRRALECWLVLDLALFLDAQGYTVALRRFCPASVTPRNLLLSARLP